MASSRFYNIILLTISCLCVNLMTLPSFVHSQETGTATFYTPPYQPSSCYGFEEQGVMIAAASDAIYNNGGACGQMYQVSCLSGTNLGTPMPCLGGSVTVKIVDHCPPGSCRGTIDLSQEAFASIADPASGVINISYQQYELTYLITSFQV
ncbi:EG45-like domain containing protein [Humulus lupulus]|uniref:EG45-like domain containing protein n=1 Tax=Humulus lupulus TaxID=3486 RepID=UPI002B40DBB5|nr:EG45-like domain containing protein [Humulus lupulus]